MKRQANVKIELKSKPVNAEKIENQIIKNKMEIESLKSEKDNSNDRIQTLENDNKKLNSSLDIILKEWKSYEEKIHNLNLLKEDLENKKIELKSAERKGNLNLAGKLAHLVIPEIEENIKKIENNNKIILENKKVTDDDIATVLSNWTGIPTSKILETEKSSLLNLDNILKKKVIGQDTAQ